MPVDPTHLLTERGEDGLLLVTLNRPEVRNAFNTAMGQEIFDLFTGLVRDAREIRCVIMTGAGDKAFCAGADLKEREGMDEATWFAQHALYERMMLAVVDCPVPVIAAVNGAAMGGGFELMLCCDFAYASTAARFALPEVSRGIMPGGGGTQTLPRAIGERRAKEIIWSGRPVSAETASEWGIVNRLCAPEDLMAETLALAVAICANAPLAIRQTKKAIHWGLQMDQRTGMAVEVEAYNHLIPTEDRREGVLAFNEKRPPRFKGR
jgi:enoyl-CoA hydratase